jgi:nucleotide-binding universal stress UspA family protein
MNDNTPHFLVGALDEECTGEALAYAQEIGQALGSQVDCWRAVEHDEKLEELLIQAQKDCDLLFLSEPAQLNFLSRLLNRSVYRKILDAVPASLWLARQPRWPIESILLIVRGEEGEEAAEEWTIRLAQAFDADVTVQIISPAAPGMYREGSRIQTRLDILLATDAPVGVQLRRILRRLQSANIEGRLQQHWGTPNEQIEREIAAADHDLVVIGAEKQSKFWRWWLGELVEPLVRWLDRPILIVR